MPKLACRACGRQIYTVAPLEALFAEERRCPRCGAYMDDERRDTERRTRIRRQNPPTTPARPATSGGSRSGASPGGARRRAKPVAASTRVALLGLGLIGGSIARALRDEPAAGYSIAAWTPHGSGPRLAAQAGIIDVAARSPEAAIDGADVVILAAPPLATQALLRDLGGPLRPYLRPDAVVTDVASTKAAIVALAAELGLRFVGGHPMAGREVTGFEASDASLLRKRPWVLVPSGDEAAIAIRNLTNRQNKTISYDAASALSLALSNASVFLFQGNK